MLNLQKYGIICGNAMMDKTSESAGMRFSAAYPTGREHSTLLRVEGVRIISRVTSFAETMAAEGSVERVDCAR